MSITNKKGESGGRKEQPRAAAPLGGFKFDWLIPPSHFHASASILSKQLQKEFKLCLLNLKLQLLILFWLAAYVCGELLICILFVGVECCMHQQFQSSHPTLLFTKIQKSV